MKNKLILLTSIVSIMFCIMPSARGQWVRVSNGLPQQGMTVYTLSAIDTTLIAGTTRGAYRSTDLGMTWQICSNFRGTGYDSTNTAFIFAAGSLFYDASPSLLYFSTNMGQTWNWDTNAIGPNSGGAVAEGSMLIIGTDYGIYRWAGGSSKWQMANGLPNSTLIYGFAALGSDLFAATASGVFRSTDSGANWSSTSYGSTTSVIASIDTILVASVGAPNGYLITSSDRGGTWIQRGGNSNGDALVASAPYIFEGSVDSGVYVSSDAGQHWSTAHEGLQRALITSLAVCGGYVFTGTAQGSGTYPSDEGVWRRPLSDFATAGVAQAASATFELSPNPTSGISTVHNAPAEAHVIVINMLGQTVLEIANSGSTDFTLDLSRLAPGAYCVRLVSPEGSITKMIVRE
jgi:hypothetical protein